MFRITTFCMTNARFILFRVCCLLLALTFMPETAWSQHIPHECTMQDGLPEAGEETPCGEVPNESAEDPADSFIHIYSSPADVNPTLSRIDWHTVSFNIPEHIQDTLSPPPRR